MKHEQWLKEMEIKDRERVALETNQRNAYERLHKKLEVDLSKFKQSDLDRFFLRQGVLNGTQNKLGQHRHA